MARLLTPHDAHTLVNALVKQMTGQTTIAATDASTFVSTGEFLLNSGVEKVFNTLSLVLGQTRVASRVYRGKFSLINAIDTGLYSHRIRKISFYSKDAQPAGNFNTDAFTNFEDGFNAGENPAGTPPVPQSTKSQWEQNYKHPFEVSFGGSDVWQYGITRLEDDIKAAFVDEASFNSFINGMLVEVANDIESEREAFNRMTINSEIIKRYYLERQNITVGGAVNLTAAFNAYYSTSYTTADLLSTYLKEFNAFLVVKIREISDRMTERGTAFHDPFTTSFNGVNQSVLRHTPYEKQRIMLYAPILRYAEATVLPEIFRPGYLDLNKQFEKVDYWQSNYNDTVRSEINMNSAYLDHGTGVQTATGAIDLKMVVGCIFDEDAVMTDMQLQSARTTNVEARKGIINTWYNFAKNSIGDQSENFVVLYMAD